MDEHVCKVLEFDKICTFLENFAQSPGGRRLCRATKPCTLLKSVQRLQQETTEMRSEIEASGPLAFGGVQDIKSDVQRTHIQNFNLDSQKLLQIAEMLETSATIKSFFSGLEDKAPVLFQHTATLTPLHTLVSRIYTCISDRGDILDTASKQLADLRRHMRSLHSNILRSLEKYHQDVDLSFALQDDFITMRNNRFVIPVRSDRRAAIQGVIHDQSQTKATFFIEPLETLELNNTLQITQKDIAREEIRILNELTLAVQQQESEILSNLAILEELDAIHARALLSRAMTARPAKNDNEKTITLKNCRHPILSARFIPSDTAIEPVQTNKTPSGIWVFDRTDVVEIEVIKKPIINILVITGANAGGKTVALKTLGLFILMHQSGMHLPVGPGAHVAHYNSLFADIGDEQNIESSLSTFSAHMERIKDVVTSATSQSLVLLDELGSGTDPAEGGAIAAAILDHLRALGCTTMVTSHLNQLKAYAHTYEDSENVSVEFDPDTHRPLYRLTYGLPGFSNALSMARNIGLPESILTAAKSHAGQADNYVAKLVHTLEHSQHVLLEKQKKLSELQEQNRELIHSSRRLFKTMHDRRDRFLKKFEENCRTLMSESENRLRSIIKQHRRQLRQASAAPPDANPMGEIHKVKHELYSRFLPKTQMLECLEHVDSGQRVKIVSLKKTGIVVNVDTVARRAEVDIGSMRVKVGFQDLTTAGTHEKKIKRPPQPHVQSQKATETSFEKKINVIGLRVAEALPLIDKTIDTAMLQGANILEIIHGRGTGRLMRAIHEHLQDHIQVARLISDPNHSNSGITRIELK